MVIAASGLGQRVAANGAFTAFKGNLSGLNRAVRRMSRMNQLNQLAIWPNIDCK